MGHIELAAPVAHIWFVKGIPSHMGLLLDLSPRSLERVLYFAQYIITHVGDEDAKQKAIERMRDDAPRRLSQREDAISEKIEELRSQLDTSKEAAKKKPSDISEEISQLEHQLAEENREIATELEDSISEIEDLHTFTLLTESKYRELKGKYGDFFEAGMGAEAILHTLQNLNLEELCDNLRQEINSTSGQRRKKAIKRLYTAEAFYRSGNKPEWMILSALPVLPPDLRPMVQLDGGRFAASDLNDLYRRVINRNSRLKRLLELGAPEMIIRNEKRMLQEAVDSLIDNGRQKRAFVGMRNRPLKSRSEVLRGKQGRFRQNLLGKRVDYSGRSVIVVGPKLKLHQCGLPKRMALELFKPFVMSHLVQEGFAANIKSAKRMVERAKAEVWSILEEVIKERLVLLNRAPTLHRLSIQAFEPVLIEDSAIQLHPLVCAAFNADFDGDQMAVHVPLSKAAVREARELMLSTHNMLLPSSGDPVIAPTLDIVLGCYYLTSLSPGAKGEGMVFNNFEEADLAYNLDLIDLRSEIEVREDGTEQRIKTTLGRIIFNSTLPEELRFINAVVDKSSLKQVIAQCIQLLGNVGAAIVIDNIKDLGFKYATKSGTTIAASDIKVPPEKAQIMEEAEKIVSQIDDQFYRGLITDDESYSSKIQVWTEATDNITDILSQSLDRYGGIYMMATSGAKGNISQIRQMAGMRGLMTDPSGKIIDFPIRSSFRDGLSMLEYFISTHGARKGLADTALRTSDAGYLTRRLVDVAQEVIIFDEDCGTTDGIWLTVPTEEFLPPLRERIIWRMAASSIVDPNSGKVIVNRNEEIDEERAKEIIAAGITQVYARSPLTCQSRHGVCQYCYGSDLTRGSLVGKHCAVGIVAAQSIGEPGTQLTLRTFHTGGIAGIDITSGLPRVEELFEVRIPKGQAVLSGIDGVVEVSPAEEGYRIKVASSEFYRDEYLLPPDSEWTVEDGDWIEIGTALAKQASLPDNEESEVTAVSPITPILARVSGKINITGNQLFIDYEEKEEEEYLVPVTTIIRVEDGAKVRAGAHLTEGSITLMTSCASNAERRCSNTW
jgi:DNA-directed RNA polymerase subunit beta'